MAALGIALTLLATASPALGASGGTWTISPSGTITNPKLVGSSFSGSCTLSGVTSGTSGGCALTLNVVTSTTSFTCDISLTVTQWYVGALPSGLADFVVKAGSVAVTAPTAQEGESCVYVSFPAGTVDPYTGAVTAPINTRIPAASGTYLLGGYGQLSASATVVVSYSS